MMNIPLIMMMNDDDEEEKEEKKEDRFWKALLSPVRRPDLWCLAHRAW